MVLHIGTLERTRRHIGGTLKRSRLPENANPSQPVDEIATATIAMK